MRISLILLFYKMRGNKFMSIQVIVATMNQTDYSLLDKMNIQSDAIICNQCGKTEFTEFKYRGHNIKWFSFAESGVGLNRNNGLMRATADIILFADDDVVYKDGYVAIIEECYEKYSKADIIIFNINRKESDDVYKPLVLKNGKATRMDITKYGTVCISARREKLHFENITFHIQFGGGTLYSCGEDTLFLQDCCKKKLSVYLTKNSIGYFEQGKSTWFKGYTDKFFFDKGVLYYCINRNFARFFALWHCVKHRKKYNEYGCKKALQQMIFGINMCKKRG